MSFLPIQRRVVSAKFGPLSIEVSRNIYSDPYEASRASDLYNIIAGIS